MTQISRFSGLLLLALCTGGSAHAREVDAIEMHYRVWLPLHPLDATDLGLHGEIDGRLPDLSPAGLHAQLAELDTALPTLDAAAHAKACDEHCQIDVAAVRHYIQAERLELMELRPVERYADLGLDLVSRSVFPIIKRDFAPLADRAQLAIARLDASPKLLTQALAALRSSKLVTKISIEITLEEVPGTADFLAKDVPAAFVSLKDAKLRARVTASAERAATALRDYGKTLKNEIMPNARADFALGEPLFTQLIRTKDAIEEPLPQLLARGQAELARLQREFRDTAYKIDPKLDPRAVKAALGKDHASGAALLADVKKTLTALRRYVIDHDIASVSSEVMPLVEETPPFLRATTQASMDTPGPYEKRATEAYYHITLPDPAWSPARVEDYLSGAFNRTLVEVVSIHEAFPGHYVQLLSWQKLTDRARRMQGNDANIEGWAHYCEEMMLEAGWGGGAPKLKLAQLSDALLRAARYVVAIRMHTQGMTLDQAKQFFVDEGFQSSEVASLEAKRGTGDPLFLHYTWGKLQIYAMRKELQARWGKAFSLRRFHDAFLAEGPIPLSLMKRALLK